MNALPRLATALSAALPALAQAHGGHGLPGESHWHATDLWGVVLIVAVLAAALSSVRRK